VLEVAADDVAVETAEVTESATADVETPVEEAEKTETAAPEAEVADDDATSTGEEA